MTKEEFANLKVGDVVRITSVHRKHLNEHTFVVKKKLKLSVNVGYSGMVCGTMNINYHSISKVVLI